MRAVVAVLLISLVVTPPGHASAQLFQATNLQFSTWVSNDGNYTVIGSAVNNTIARSSLRGGKLFFSFTMLGLQPAVDYLQQNGSLQAHVVVYGGITALNTIDCGITQEKWLEIGQSLLGTFNTQSVFSFRTWMYTLRTSYNSLTLIVRDETDREITRAAININ